MDASQITLLGHPPAQPVLPNDLATCHRMIEELLETLQTKERQLAGVQHRLSLLLQKVYGQRRERINPDQLLLFAQLVEAVKPEEEEGSSGGEEEGAELEPAGRKKRRGHGRQQLPKDLPRIPVLHDLTEAEKLCPGCGCQRQKIGEETSSQLEYQPASVFVLDHTRYTYACPKCAGHVQTAAKPAPPIDKGLPGPGLLAHVTTSKYADHLPLYRQERILERFGVTLSRLTQSGGLWPRVQRTGFAGRLPRIRWAM